MLPNEEGELLAGLKDGYELAGFTCQEELEDYDLFGSVGGIEFENDTQESLNTVTTKIDVPDGLFEKIDVLVFHHDCLALHLRNIF